MRSQKPEISLQHQWHSLEQYKTEIYKDLQSTSSQEGQAVESKSKGSLQKIPPNTFLGDLVFTCIVSKKSLSSIRSCSLSSRENIVYSIQDLLWFFLIAYREFLAKGQNDGRTDSQELRSNPSGETLVGSKSLL